MEPEVGVGEITLYLRRLSDGDQSAEGPLADAVYAQLQRMARYAMNGVRGDSVLQPTALVNQVLLELIRLRSVDWQDRIHFFRVASRLLRRRFIDHIRSAEAQKRPSARDRVDVEDVLLPSPNKFEEIILVHEGLTHLASYDGDLAELVEMVYFGGVTIAAAAELRGVSEKTVDRHLDFARRWLAKDLRINCPSIGTATAFSNGR